MFHFSPAVWPNRRSACDLIKSPLHRKNALFYKTLNGARVGDLFMSLIHTCSLAGVNPVEYLTALQEHAAEMTQNPEKWLPWNYTAALRPDPS